LGSAMRFWMDGYFQQIQKRFNSTAGMLVTDLICFHSLKRCMTKAFWKKLWVTVPIGKRMPCQKKIKSKSNHLYCTRANLYVLR